MNSYIQHVQRALPNVKIHSCKQNDKGWDNVAIIINQEWLFRFPRKLEYAKKIPREKQLCEALSQSLQNIKVPQYHLLYKKKTDKIPICSYYKLIHGEPFTRETLERLTPHEQNKIITQLASFLAALHMIPVESAIKCGFSVEHPTSYWRHLQSKLEHYLSSTLTTPKRKVLDYFFEAFFEQIHVSALSQTIIHADFTHQHILFHEKRKQIAGIIDFGDAQIGDPAFDFAGLYNDFGSEFTYEVYKQYRTLAPHRDSSFFERIIHFYQYSPLLHNLIYTFEINDIKMMEENQKELGQIFQGMC
ncbi:aminoglycoside phosphotransferase family protein [Bacillus sp. DX4.1]|uniref:aminoglycoside phosphotransferase family protein n=1 Tax=Bacillus sp. DX4.1 TaxID=3055867 RepID=UPI0025A2C8EB|nr:aminoglycoside phosphotransferase family protein [Bacillus sp. DX4.1]MDM5187670.1 aminoglycoside phosphotransferase family protein [Bacillus sp. DX4.1]